MTKEQIIEILKKCEKESGVYFDTFDLDHSIEEMNNAISTEIISLYQTGQTDAVIDPEREMLKGFNQEPIPGRSD